MLLPTCLGSYYKDLIFKWLKLGKVILVTILSLETHLTPCSVF